MSHLPADPKDAAAQDPRFDPQGDNSAIVAEWEAFYASMAPLLVMRAVVSGDVEAINKANGGQFTDLRPALVQFYPLDVIPSI